MEIFKELFTIVSRHFSKDVYNLGISKTFATQMWTNMQNMFSIQDLFYWLQEIGFKQVWPNPLTNNYQMNDKNSKFGISNEINNIY